jgi:rhamnogalacturonan endolyase
MRNSACRYLFVNALVVGGVLLASSSVGRATPETAPVRLTETKTEAMLSNGIVTATIAKRKARIAALRYGGRDMLTAAYYSMDGGPNFRTPSSCRVTIKEQTPELVDIGLKQTWSDEPQAFDIDIHYVLRRGDSGLYTYALLDHPARYPATGVAEWRMVWKLSDDLLERIYVDDLRRWQMPGSSDKSVPTPIKEIRKVLTGPRAGKFDCKYDFNANYWDLGCWGHASDRNKIGAWIVLGSHEFCNDGPTKQDLTAASGINHIHFGMNHYNGSSIRVAAGQTWRKMFGPFLLYCNHADGGDACWADAQQRARREQAAWPYRWLTANPEYPLAAARGAAAGRFVVKDPLKPNLTGQRAWIGLAEPPPGGNWQFESLHYQYWTRADAAGNFKIAQVRPGVYTLYAFTAGAVGEFVRPGVRIEAARTNALGQVRWNVPHRGRIAWEIGVPDRTAKEFRHGDDYFQGFLWTRVDREFQNPLDYDVGRSDWRKDWNYAQARYLQDPATPHTWRIHFHLAAAPRGDATLTLAIASADHASIRVFANGGREPVAEVVPHVQGGNALLREGIHAKYCVEYVSIPAGQLTAGDNTLALVLSSVRQPGAHVMYDYLSLEVP